VFRPGASNVEHVERETVPPYRKLDTILMLGRAETAGSQRKHMFDRTTGNPPPPSRKRWWTTFGVIFLASLIATLVSGRIDPADVLVVVLATWLITAGYYPGADGKRRMWKSTMLALGGMLLVMVLISAAA
jgi:hypothetical protein